MSAVTLNIDTSDLLAMGKRIVAAQRVTSKGIAVGLNEVGDSLVAVLATNIAKDTGLQLEQVRGLMTVRRASRTNLNYEVNIHPQLAQEAARLEGRRESKDFGKRQPGQLVIIVSKKDELVCMDCEELAAAGPMPIEIAMEHIPKHPHCRCVILPYVQKGKRLPVTMTTTSGTSAQGRMGGPMQGVDDRQTIRQLAQKILNNTHNDIKIELR
jgi:hypothetical protein